MRMFRNVAPLAITLLGAALAAHSQTVLATLDYPLGVNGVAVDYLHDQAYVLLPNYNNGENAVQVLDAKNNAVVATYTVPVSGAIAVNVLTGLVYIAGSVPSSTNPSGIESIVAVLNPKTGAVTAQIPVTATAGFGIVALAVDPVTDRIFASNASDNTIAVINGAKNAVTAAVTLDGQTPAGLGVDFLRSRVYAALNDNQVAILAESKDSVAYASYGSQTAAVAVDPFLGREYVADGVFTSPTVGVLNSKGTTVASVPVGLFPQGVDVDFVLSTVFVANEADGTISEIDGQNNTVVDTISIAANSVAVNPRQSTVYAVGSTSVTIFTEN